MSSFLELRELHHFLRSKLVECLDAHAPRTCSRELIRRMSHHTSTRRPTKQVARRSARSSGIATRRLGRWLIVRVIDTAGVLSILPRAGWDQCFVSNLAGGNQCGNEDHDEPQCTLPSVLMPVQRQNRKYDGTIIPVTITRGNYDLFLRGMVMPHLHLACHASLKRGEGDEAWEQGTKELFRVTPQPLRL